MVPSEGGSRLYKVEATALDVEGVGMVSLTVGNLNVFTIQNLDPELREIIQTKAKESYLDLILDISQVQVIDSSGIGALVALHGFAKQKGLTLHRCGADPKVAGILRIMKIHRVVRMHASRDSALKACAGDGEGRDSDAI